LKIANNIFMQSAAAKGSMARLRVWPTGTNELVGVTMPQDTWKLRAIYRSRTFPWN
jgi:hypothetical protein